MRSVLKKYYLVLVNYLAIYRLEVWLLECKKIFSFFLGLFFVFCFSISSASAEFLKVEKKGSDFTLSKGNGINKDIFVNAYNNMFDFDLGEKVDIQSLKFNSHNIRNYQSVYFKFLDETGNFLIAYDLSYMRLLDNNFHKLPSRIDGVRYVVVVNNSGVGISCDDFIVSSESKGLADFPPKGSSGIIRDESFFYPYVKDIVNLNVVEGVNDVQFNWTNSVDEHFTGVQIYQNGSLIDTVDKNVNFYQVKGLEANKNYTFKFVAVYGDKKTKGITKSVKTLVDPKTIPPGSVYSLTAEPTDTTVKLKWKKPRDEDLAGFKILSNGRKIAEIGLEEEFTVKNLEPLKEYYLGVVAVDKDGNDSSPVNLTVKTLEEKNDVPPLVPANVFAKASNGALIASWDRVTSRGMAGYNLYLDGKKINSNLISSSNFIIKNLENDKKYKVQVQAVDRWGNVSELSLPAYGTPDLNTIPILSSKYDLQDISDGVSGQFWQIWPYLAFAIGIPLAFYIIHKIKHVILP